ncbi:MAG: S9 family peptidase [Actinobacteria bacterium]|nr:S9 family peptidase [Actinomycetota bacterium]
MSHPAPPPAAPVAPRRPTVLRHHDDERVDDWYWLRERDDPAVRAYLEAENDYTATALAHLAPLRERLFEEIRGRIRETDASAPVTKGPHGYFTRTREGLQYPVHCRRPAATPGLPDPDAEPGTAPGEIVLLDENALAGDSGYFALGALSRSPDQALVAYSTDFTGGERYTLRVRDVAAGADLPDAIPDTYYGVAWANDGATLFYTRPDDAMRPWQIWRHRLGTPVADDVLVLQEDDERYYVSVERTRSGAFLVLTSGSKLTTEVWFVDADAPDGPLTVVEPRREGVEYHVEHHRSPTHGDRFFVITNDDAESFRLVVAPVASPGRTHWTEVIAHRDDVRLDDVDAFAGHLVISERASALEQIRVLDLDSGDEHVVVMPDEVYSAGLGGNLEFDTATVRLEYTSLVAPASSYDYDLDRRTMTLVREQPVAGYDRSRLESHREWATAADGTRVPISIVHRRGLPLDGTAPMLLYGYGAYEISVDPTFSVGRLSLLDRGVVFAIAHVRGGGECGRRWYDDGKILHKRNSFSDFVACAEYLVQRGYTSPGRLAARGGSAGGLLMGAVANLAPADFRAIVAEVPFVDCLTTILDPSLPLTVTEWEEWGNPLDDPAVYEYMKSYSPFDNVVATDYPAMLVTAGIHDPRVQYWEPAKWVARLRATRTDDRLLVLRTEMDSGHSGPSGRYDAWRDEAFVLAFVLDQLGVTET